MWVHRNLYHAWEVRSPISPQSLQSASKVLLAELNMWQSQKRVIANKALRYSWGTSIVVIFSIVYRVGETGAISPWESSSSHYFQKQRKHQCLPWSRVGPWESWGYLCDPIVHTWNRWVRQSRVDRWEELGVNPQGAGDSVHSHPLESWVLSFPQKHHEGTESILPIWQYLFNRFAMHNNLVTCVLTDMWRISVLLML